MKTWQDTHEIVNVDVQNIVPIAGVFVFISKIIFVKFVCLVTPSGVVMHLCPAYGLCFACT